MPVPNHSTKSNHVPGNHPLRAIIKAIILAPLYFMLLTLFGLWPWRFGSPFFLLKPLRVPPDAQKALDLRLLTHRLILRDEHLLSESSRPSMKAYRIKRWLRSPWFTTFRPCMKFTRREMERTGQSGASAAVSIFCNALVDSYRYANATMHRDWFDQERRADGAQHLPNDYHIRVCCYLLNHKLNPSMPLSQRHYDKSEFHRVCENHALPTVPVYAVFDQGGVIHQAEVPDEQMISKPVDMAEGNGVFTRWTPVGGNISENRQYYGEDGKSRTTEEVFDQLKKQSRDGPYLLQKKIFNHDAIRKLAGTDTLCTLRVPTCRFPDGKVNVLPFAFIRMPTNQDAAVDNMTRGSIAFPVALDTGCMEDGGQFGKFSRFTDHPTTGNRVVGVELPYWQESLELCMKAHAEAFPTFPTVGWDVAITADGPLLLEMNIQWVRPVGLPDELFSGQTPYVDCILAHMQIFWPGQMPSAGRSKDGL